MLNRREWITGSAALAGLAAMPVRAAEIAAGKTPMHLVHPELRDVVPMVEQFARGPAFARENLTQLRKQPIRCSAARQTKMCRMEKRMIAGGKGQPNVAIYIINAKPGTGRPAILHTHGGGYVVGISRMVDPGFAGIVREA